MRQRERESVAGPSAESVEFGFGNVNAGVTR